MVEEKLTRSRAPGRAQHLLERLAGNRAGSTGTWFEPGHVAEQWPTRGRMPLLVMTASNITRAGQKSKAFETTRGRA
jgi:hypothetical protein